MTKDQILAMEPGKEFDLSVHTQVFGHQLDGFDWSSETSHVLTKVVGSVIVSHSVPEYSTDISPAFEVVEHIRSLTELNGKKVRLMVRLFATHQPYVWTFMIGDYLNDSTLAEEMATTAPEAICKAALLATMEATHAE